MNQFLFSFLFILTPDKTHRLKGNWSGGSCFVLAVLSGMAINQVIHCVREGPFSIEFMTCCKKQMLQWYWKFSGYIIIWRERATVKPTRQCFIMISLPVYMSRWGVPIGQCLDSDRNGIIVIFSNDYSPQIIFWCSDFHKTNSKTARIIWLCPALPFKERLELLLLAALIKTT